MKKIAPSELTLKKIYKLIGRAVLLPLPRGKKAPSLNGWQKTTFAQTQTPAYRAALLRAIERGGNIGVLCGPASAGLCPVDIDDDAEIEPFLSSNPALVTSLCTRGANGCQIWVRPIGEYPARLVKSGLKIPGKKEGSKKSIAEWRGGWWASICHLGQTS